MLGRTKSTFTHLQASLRELGTFGAVIIKRFFMKKSEKEKNETKLDKPVLQVYKGHVKAKASLRFFSKALSLFIIVLFHSQTIEVCLYTTIRREKAKASLMNDHRGGLLFFYRGIPNTAKEKLVRKSAGKEGGYE